MTKAEIIAELKAQYPTLNKGVDNETIALNDKEYNETIGFWADNILAKQAVEAEAQAKAAAKAALLDRLGITADEAKLLLA